VYAVAERLGVAHTLDRAPQALSGGEMQRVAIARAIVRQARVYLLDQPLSNLDAQLREQMRSELKRLHREIGSTLVYATSDQLEAMTMPDRLAVVRDGRVLQCASPEETYFRPTHAFAAEYVGDPPMNLLSADVSDDGLLRTRCFELEHPGLPDGDWVLGIRPEDLHVGVDEDHVHEGDVAFEASVFATEMCGDHHVLTLAVGEDRLSALWSRGDSPPGHADRAIVRFAPECVHLIDAASERVVSSSRSQV
jgi:ABC-type sugar transport system ATPase subunit